MLPNRIQAFLLGVAVTLVVLTAFALASGCYKSAPVCDPTTVDWPRCDPTQPPFPAAKRDAGADAR